MEPEKIGAGLCCRTQSWFQDRPRRRSKPTRRHHHTPNSLEKENILQEQKADAFCCTQSPGAYSSKSEFFLDNDGVMYRRQKCVKNHLVIPQSLILNVIAENHNPKFGAQPGMKRTYSLFSLLLVAKYA